MMKRKKKLKFYCNAHWDPINFDPQVNIYLFGFTFFKIDIDIENKICDITILNFVISMWKDCLLEDSKLSKSDYLYNIFTKNE